ncbi:nucleoside-diphosphate sugar epimerase/dehydratase [Bacillus sp. N1-1]|jgi:FlaA1/EpsC-like NDP-sugar epimerase|uniref:polysaccharide biosynthesis protein n=1 Tax=Bacillus sp. N1-1 TaxID=2682541 RepID=UPI001318A3DF|nr:nucleoside-diphosphate sugar epimerase/dehydratase [Bacillus sp. N1-1]QHA93650.1 NAD-dependent epimerase/dehydratase family protein [Bacillus sp. N1-1]
MSVKNRFYSLSLLDSLIVFSSVYLTTIFLFPISPVLTVPLFIISMTLVVSHHFYAQWYKLYKRAWEFAGVGEMIIIFKAVTLSVITASVLQFVIMQDIYLRVLLSTWMMQLILISASRFSWRLFRDRQMGSSKVETDERTLIIGAGSAGTLVARQLQQNSDCHLNPIAFIDDDKRKQQLDILCIPVVGGIASLQENVERLKIEKIVIAIPSLSKNQLNRIYQECKKTNIKTQMIPMFEDLVTGKVSVNEIRDVQVDDLLGRKPIELDTHSIETMVTGSVVLITGAGGSIGSEICRQVSQFHPAMMILLGHGENSIYTIEKELKTTCGDEIEIVTEIADIKDRKRMFSIMNAYRPRVVFHAAAHKHVPLMERHPAEAVANNIFGTKNVAEASAFGEVETFVMISTDKAVNPTSVMGATKRIAEMVVQNLDKKSETRFVAVRFGNVLGSRGSVIPLFKEQVKKGGPVTVTHPDMERYFMTIPEASRLVLQAAALAKGGEVFVLDMGEPVKIVDLAKNLIKLSGLTENEIEIKFSGMRPGEKMFEELLNDHEMNTEQVHPKIYVGHSIDVPISDLLSQIDDSLSLSDSAVRELLLSMTNTLPAVEKSKPVLI